MRNEGAGRAGLGRIAPRLLLNKFGWSHGVKTDELCIFVNEQVFGGLEGMMHVFVLPLLDRSARVDEALQILDAVPAGHLITTDGDRYWLHDWAVLEKAGKSGTATLEQLTGRELGTSAVPDRTARRLQFAVPDMNKFGSLAAKHDDTRLFLAWTDPRSKTDQRLAALFVEKYWVCPNGDQYAVMPPDGLCPKDQLPVTRGSD